MGTYLPTKISSWDSPDFAGIAWSSMTGSWDSWRNKIGSEEICLGMDEETALHRSIDGRDDGVAFSYSWETITFVVPVNYLSSLARWAELEIEVKGLSEVGLWYQTERSPDWISLGNVSMTSVWTRVKIPFDVVSQTIRFKFGSVGDAQAFFLRWLRVWLRPSGRD